MFYTRLKKFSSFWVLIHSDVQLFKCSLFSDYQASECLFFRSDIENAASERWYLAKIQKNYSTEWQNSSAVQIVQRYHSWSYFAFWSVPFISKFPEAGSSSTNEGTAAEKSPPANVPKQSTLQFKSSAVIGYYIRITNRRGGGLVSKIKFLPKTMSPSRDSNRRLKWWASDLTTMPRNHLNQYIQVLYKPNKYPVSTTPPPTPHSTCKNWKILKILQKFGKVSGTIKNEKKTLRWHQK